MPHITKADALARANGLADGFVLLGVGGAAEEAWTWVIEGRNEPTINYDLELLHKFAHTFPTAHLTDFIDDYCRLFKLPLPEPDEEDADSPNETAGSEDKVKYKRPRRGKGKNQHVNARERRRQRRAAAKQEGELSEDIDEEEHDELVASMTVS